MHIKRPRPHFAPKTPKDDEDGGLDFLSQEVEERAGGKATRGVRPPAEEVEEEEEGVGTLPRAHETLVEELKAALSAQDEYIEELKKQIVEDGQTQEGLAYIAQTYREHRDSLRVFVESIRSLRDLEIQQLKGEIEALQVQVSVLEKEVKVYQEAFERVDKIKSR